MLNLATVIHRCSVDLYELKEPFHVSLQAPVAGTVAGGWEEQGRGVRPEDGLGCTTSTEESEEPRERQAHGEVRKRWASPTKSGPPMFTKPGEACAATTGTDPGVPEARGRVF